MEESPSTAREEKQRTATKETTPQASPRMAKVRPAAGNLNASANNHVLSERHGGYFSAKVLSERRYPGAQEPEAAHPGFDALFLLPDMDAPPHIKPLPTTVDPVCKDAR